jgi:hypothetical protein
LSFHKEYENTQKKITSQIKKKKICFPPIFFGKSTQKPPKQGFAMKRKRLDYYHKQQPQQKKIRVSESPFRLAITYYKNQLDELWHPDYHQKGLIRMLMGLITDKITIEFVRNMSWCDVNYILTNTPHQLPQELLQRIQKTITALSLYHEFAVKRRSSLFNYPLMEETIQLLLINH